MRPAPLLAAMRVGLDTLRANPLRTLLSVLGVIMGVASLVAVLAIGDGVERFARDQIEQTTDLQTIALQPRVFEEVDGMRLPRKGGYPVFTLADRDALAAALGPAAGVAPLVQGLARLTIPGDTTPRSAAVLGTGPAALARARLAAGRFFTESELRDSARVAVISAGLAARLGGAATALGREITLEGTPFRVIGVVEATGKEQAARVAVPFTRATSAMVPPDGPRPPALMVRAARVESVQVVRAGVERWTAQRYGARWADQVRIEVSGGGRLEQAQQGILVFKLVMGAFAAIALLVGGIGIMNVLVASVIERTREIGI
ncbi:MAG TPA: ABC transporter permease, partial [Gemmatimonadales bacterium]|nr:ABC transporter permease [Gemmatimonadales bacterium]